MRHRKEEFVFAEYGVFLRGEDKVVVFAHDDGFFGADFLAEAAVDASEHIDFKEFGVAFFFLRGFGGANFDGKRRAYPRA